MLRRSIPTFFICVLCTVPFFASAVADPVAVSVTGIPVSPPGLTPPPPPTSACPNFARTFGKGSRGSDVQLLQQQLIAQKVLAGDLATGYFGSLTEAAVRQFQAREGVVSSGTAASTGFGFFGMKTRAALARLCLQGSPGASFVPQMIVNTITRPLSCTYTSQTGTVRTPTLPASYTADMCRSACDTVHTGVFGLSDLGSCTFVNTNGDITTTSYTYTQATTYTPGTQIPVQIRTQTRVASTTNISYPTPECSIFSDATTISGHEKVTLTWISNNATEAQWIPDAADGTFSIPPPPGDVSLPSGSFSFTPSAAVFSGQIVNPGLLLKVTGPGGYATCGTRITPREN